MSLISMTGSPPRVRGGALGQVSVRREHGITPACAGRRQSRCILTRCPKDHPRVCGEEPRDCTSRGFRPGSPPRVRGGVHHQGFVGRRDGITPACAGRRGCVGRLRLRPRDHPRVCGEECLSKRRVRRGRGSPPRVRGGVFHDFKHAAAGGITPACAGRSQPFPQRNAHNGDHPRVCGEEGPFPFPSPFPLGSPPRVRGGAAKEPPHQPGEGITPACAGRSILKPNSLMRMKDHPRVCGEEGTWTAWRSI